MQTHVVLTREAIPVALAGLPDPWRIPPGTGDGEVGAWLDFYGIVRGEEDVSADRAHDAENRDPKTSTLPITALDYEAHEEMAVHQMERILVELAAAYPVRSALVLHRLGVVPVGEPSLLVRVLAPHRQEAFAACLSFVEELKKWVPIWKHPLHREP